MALPSQQPRRAAEPGQQAEALRLIDRYRPAVIGELRSLLEGRSQGPYALMRYHLGWEDRRGKASEGQGGKLLRPALCLLCCEAVGGDWRRALPAAAALELLHNFTLIHDDVEDASLQRHGRDTLWRLWGQAQAINVGDGMFALAQVALLRLADLGHPPDRVVEAARLLNQATLQLCEGQHRDLTYAQQPGIGRDEYLTMIRGKTAALLAAASALGALLGEAAPEVVGALQEFGHRLGLAFQIRDDILGIWGDVEETGKPAGDDIRAGKKSYPIVVAFERVSGPERETLHTLHSARELGDEDVRRVCELLERLGAREEAQQATLEQAEDAIACLRGLPLRREQRLELEWLARFAAQRRS